MGATAAAATTNTNHNNNNNNVQFHHPGLATNNRTHNVHILMALAQNTIATAERSKQI